MNSSCRFCYSYTPQKFNASCCNKVLCAPDIPIVPSTSEQSLLLQKQKEFLLCSTKPALESAIANNIQNNAQIGQQLYSQLLQYGKNRDVAYQRLPPPFIPPSVMALQMNTANVGVPHTIVERCSGR
jgi:hypothetical protein